MKKKWNRESAETKVKSLGVRRSEKPGEEFGSDVQESDKNKLVFFESCSYTFDLEDLLRASAEVLGKGRLQFWRNQRLWLLKAERGDSREERL